MGTAVVGLVLAVVVAAVVKSLVKNKKSGKSSCGGNCAACHAGCAHAVGTVGKEGEVSPSLQTSATQPFSATPSAGSNAARNACFSATLHIGGMMCGMCESHINDAIRVAFNVKKIKTSHKTGICQIESEEKLDAEKLRQVIEKTGYKLESIS